MSFQLGDEEIFFLRFVPSFLNTKPVSIDLDLIFRYRRIFPLSFGKYFFTSLKLLSTNLFPLIFIGGRAKTEHPENNCKTNLKISARRRETTGRCQRTWETDRDWKTETSLEVKRLFLFIRSLGLFHARFMLLSLCISWHRGISYLCWRGSMHFVGCRVHFGSKTFKDFYWGSLN